MEIKFQDNLFTISAHEQTLDHIIMMIVSE